MLVRIAGFDDNYAKIIIKLKTLGKSVERGVCTCPPGQPKLVAWTTLVAGDGWLLASDGGDLLDEETTGLELGSGLAVRQL